jgi:hypothetical protein
MSPSLDRFIEDENQDKQCLTATGLMIHLNGGRSTRTIERVKTLQAMLLLQQQRLQQQQDALQALAVYLNLQERKVYQTSPHLAHQWLPDGDDSFMREPTD